jgi:hypothetical protein
MILLRLVPNVVVSREGWELYIVTDGIIVGMFRHFKMPSSGCQK